MRQLSAGVLNHPVVIAAIIFAGGFAAICLFLWVASPMLFTLALSAIFYAALSATVDSLTRREVDRSIAVAIVMVVVVILMLVISSLLYPAISHEFSTFAARADSLEERMLAICSELNQWTQRLIGYHFDPVQLSHNIVDNLNSSASDISNALASYFSEVAFSLLLVPLITFFLLRDYRMLRNETMQVLPNRYFELGWMIYNVATAQLQNYTRGVMTQAISMTLICTFGFWLAGIEYAPVLGVLVGLLNMIPFFGITLAKVPPVLVVLLSDNPDAVSVLLALGVVFFAQAVDSVYLLPRVVAKSASLHPISVMLGVMLGGYYFGFLGLILSVPVMFSMKVIYLELLRGIRHFNVSSSV